MRDLSFYFFIFFFKLDGRYTEGFMFFFFFTKRVGDRGELNHLWRPATATRPGRAVLAVTSISNPIGQSCDNTSISTCSTFIYIYILLDSTLSDIAINVCTISGRGLTLEEVAVGRYTRRDHGDFDSNRTLKSHLKIASSDLKKWRQSFN